MAADVVQYQVTVDDPVTYPRPFTISMPLTPLDGGALLPYDCHEGNLAIRQSLGAERAEDAALAADLAKGIKRERRRGAVAGKRDRRRGRSAWWRCRTRWRGARPTTQAPVLGSRQTRKMIGALHASSSADRSPGRRKRPLHRDRRFAALAGQQSTIGAGAPPLVITAYNGGPPINYTVPRTPWGDPDLQGVWSVTTRPTSRRRGRRTSATACT